MLSKIILSAGLLVGVRNFTSYLFRGPQAALLTHTYCTILIIKQILEQA